MRCNETKELLELFIDNALSEESRGQVERHLLRCAGCAFEVRSIEQARALLQEAYPRGESSPAFRERMAARLEEAFADQLRPEPQEASRQRELPFLL
jgi:anti-sigma factor RsiW